MAMRWSLLWIKDQLCILAKLLSIRPTANCRPVLATFFYLKHRLLFGTVPKQQSPGEISEAG